MRNLRTILIALCLVALLSASSRAATTKLTVSQLNSLLADLSQQHKTDEFIATRLKEVELSELLTTPALNSLIQYKPGQLTIRQILLLSVESSLLPPPPADLPSTAAPDSDTQAALLHRASDHASHDLTQLPRLTADKMALRFQNGIDYVRNDSGNGNKFGDTRDLHQFDQNNYVNLMGQHTEPVIFEAGTELSPPNAKKKEVAAQSTQISKGVPGLPLATVLSDAAKSPISWLRWQTIDGRLTAVFTFTVAPKDSQYKVNYCCFPIMEHIGSGMGFTENSGSASTFHPFTAAPGYHGELFIDSATGVVVRLITKANLKPTDFVLQEDIRVDYASVAIGNQHYVVPARSTILTTIAPNGDAYVKYTTRRTLFDITYSKYQLAPTSATN